MAKFTMTHEINCDADTFWRLFFDKEFNEQQYRQGLGFPEFSIVDQRETDQQITRRVSGQPKMNMPAPVMKLLGSNFRYNEEGTFDKATRTWRWRMIPSVMADKLRQEGVIRIEPVGEGKVRRVADLVMEAKIFGLGGLIESSAEKQLREGFDQSAAFMNSYVARKAG